jgi:TonB family protein
MYKNNLLAVAGIVLGTVAPASASQAQSDMAQPAMVQSDSDQSNVMSVVAPPTLSAWSQNVFRHLERRMRYPTAMGSVAANEGIVAVKFNCSESGAPAGVELYKTSGHGELDKATVSAVRRIATLHPLPRGLGHEQQYVLRVLFSNSRESARQQLAEMRKDAERSNSWYARSGTTSAMLELLPSGG